MPGVRISHPTERNTTFTLMDGNRPYATPLDCPTCHRVHQFKTFHITLDETGAGIVSPEVIERLKRIPNQPFRVMNEVARPPEQTIVIPNTIRLRPGVLAPLEG